MENEKEWTLFFYLNGNNDLSPEIYDEFLSLQNAQSNDNINIVVQISLATKQFVSIIRPLVDYQPHVFFVSGRYLIKDNKAVLFDILEDANMASPYTLSDFLQWGYEKYPAKQNVLFLGGHGYENIGCMTDLVGNGAYIMGYEEMASAIALASEKMHSSIDILFLDTCINRKHKIEDTIKEYSCGFINFLILPEENSSLEGYPIEKVINIFCEKCLNSLCNVVQDIILKLGKNLLHYELRNTVDSNKCSLALKQLNNNEIYACISSVNYNLSENSRLSIFRRLIKFNKWQRNC